MYCDPRGGHNRKIFNEHFFKSWSYAMAYILGLIYADGAVEDVRKSSRTCYLTISSNDKSLLEQVRKALSSEHTIYSRKPRVVKFSSGKSYFCRENFNIRIGNKKMFSDLINLGLTPRKSLHMKFPKIPPRYFSHFLRGYFDGDGCVMIKVHKGQSAKEVRVAFTSGCKKFLDILSKELHSYLQINNKNANRNSEAFNLAYRKRDGLKILSFMYKDLDKAPFLDRKYAIYKNYLDTLQTEQVTILIRH